MDRLLRGSVPFQVEFEGPGRVWLSNMSFADGYLGSIFTPTEEHAGLRSMVRSFARAEVDPQALEFDRKEQFNLGLFRKLGELGLLGITVEEQYGGSGMDATAAVRLLAQ